MIHVIMRNASAKLRTRDPFSARARVSGATFVGFGVGMDDEPVGFRSTLRPIRYNL